MAQDEIRNITIKWANTWHYGSFFKAVVRTGKHKGAWGGGETMRMALKNLNYVIKTKKKQKGT
jgi:hypothetical protein